MAVLSFLTKSYAANIYVYGNRNFSSVPAEYHEPVKKYAAATYSDQQLQTAFEKGWITESEYNETFAVKYPDGVQVQTLQIE